jgi:uncharacterized RDD family membrane protein YckC
MKSIAARIALGAAMLLGSASGDLRAQSVEESGLRASLATTSGAETAQDSTLLEISQDWDRDGWGRDVLRVGQDYGLKQGESVHEVVVVFSPAVIEGYVHRDVIVVLGTVQISSTAVIGGSLVVVGGNVTIERGATVHQDLAVIGGGLDAPAEFVPGGQHIAIGGTALADRLHSIVPWITEGLFLGRPIVPRLSWVWVIVAFVFLASLALNLLFMDTVRKCAQIIAARPLTTFLTGLLVLLLTGPVSIILAASVIGILVVPFVLCAVVLAWIIGKVGVAVRLGDGMTGQAFPENRLQSVRSFIIGFAAISLIYMVPLLGFMAWALVGVTGLGAASLAFASAYRRENPARPKRTPPQPPPPAPRQPDAAAGDVAVSPSMLDDVPPAASPSMRDDVPPAAYPPYQAPAVAYVQTGMGTNLLAFAKAGFFERAAAFAFDGVFVLVLCGILDALDSGPGPLIFMMLAYHIAFWTWKGTTFGGIVCQLRVVRLDGSPLRFVDALVRGIASLFSVAVAGLGFLWILRDEERQAWHDKIAGTYVVTVPRNWPLS